MSRRYLKCPDCGRRGVYTRLDGDDVLVCRYAYLGCRWYAYAGGEDLEDRRQRGRLAAANPDADVWVSALPS